MTKRKSIIITGAVLLCAVLALGVTLALIGTGIVGAPSDPLVFTSASAEAEYSGAALTSSEFALTSGALKDGHTAYAEMSGAQTEAGSSENSFTVTILDERGGDVTESYDYRCVPGTLTVKKRRLEIKSGDGSKMYDGTPLAIETYTVIDGSLADGNEIDATFGVGITKRGTADNVFSVHVSDAKGRDVTVNYDIVYDYGKLEVTKRPLTVTGESVTRKYDGTTLRSDDSEYENDLGDTVKLTYRTEIKNAGSKQNVPDVTITRDGVSVLDNYEVTVVPGTLEILPKALLIETASGSKIYDGTELTDRRWRISTETTFISDDVAFEYLGGDEITVTVFGSQTAAGSSTNDCYVASVLNGDEDVSKNYDVRISGGMLNVTRRPITVTSANASKVYDGSALENRDWAASWGIISDTKLADGDSIGVTVTGSRTEIGESANTIAEVRITRAGDDVTANYDILRAPGYLLVTGKNGTALGEPDDAYDPDTVMLRLYSKVTDKNVYLKSASYGDYTGGGFDPAPEYDMLLDGRFGYGYLASYALRNTYSPKSLTVELAYSPFLLPYYAMPDTATGQTSDTVCLSNKTVYTVERYFSYDYIAAAGAGLDLTGYDSQQAAYYAFAKANYLSVPDRTRAYLNTFAAEKGLDKNSRTLVADVARVIRGAAEYKLDYNRELDNADDIVVAFLSEYRAGVCRHYAASAVMLYRALGIPARYTTGFLGETFAGKWTDVTAEKAHAWAEVYVAGAGWVRVEVTGGADFDIGGDGVTEVTDKTIKPVDCNKKYDGAELLPTQRVQGLSKLKDYTYEVTITGSQTDVGYGVSTIDKFTLRDPDGNVVLTKNGNTVKSYDAKFDDYRFAAGRLHVYEYEITVETGSASKPFDGSALTCVDFTVISGEADLTARGHEAVVAHYVEHRTAGTARNMLNLRIVDGNGADVSELYHINYIYGTLEIERLVIDVNMRSVTVSASELAALGGKAYCTDFAVSYGDETREYSGTGEPHEIDFVLKGCSVTVSSESYNAKAGSRVEASVDSTSIYDAQGNDITEYFIIEHNEPGYITVTKN